MAIRCDFLRHNYTKFMSNIEVVAWDVYGTIVAPYCDEVRDDRGHLRAREGVIDCLNYFDCKYLFQVTCSDCDTGNVKRDLEALDLLEYFFDFFHMPPYTPKDFTNIRDFFNTDFEKILVIGDNYDIDLSLAKKQGCQILHLPLEKKITVEEAELFF